VATLRAVYDIICTHTRYFPFHPDIAYSLNGGYQNTINGGERREKYLCRAREICPGVGAAGRASERKQLNRVKCKTDSLFFFFSKQKAWELGGFYYLPIWQFKPER